MTNKKNTSYSNVKVIKYKLESRLIVGLYLFIFFLKGFIVNIGIAVKGMNLT